MEAPKEVSPALNRWMASVDKPDHYAIISVSANATAQTGIDTSFQDVQYITSDGMYYGAWPDGANSQIQIKKSGRYMAIASVSLTGTASTPFDIRVQRNDVASNFVCRVGINSAADYESATAIGIFDCVVDDIIKLTVKSNAASKSITLRDAMLLVREL